MCSVLTIFYVVKKAKIFIEIPNKQVAKIRKKFHIKAYFCNLDLTLKNRANLGNLFSRLKYLINSLPKYIETISIKHINIKV